jgi:uncharacterized linocin/CFP29 family protein
MTPDKNAALVGWTDDQWNQVLTTVTTEAQKARLAASFLPVTGPLDPVTVAVPKLTLSDPALPPGVAIGVNPAPKRLEVDSLPDLKLATVSTLVYLRSHEVADPDLAAALGMFRRAANVLARAEDFLVFNGNGTALGAPLSDLVHVSVPTAQLWNGLLSGSPVAVDPADPISIFNAVITAISDLEGKGYFGPFACVLGNTLFGTASSPANAALVSVRDRLLPYLDGLFFRSSTFQPEWGIVVALGGSPVELVLATDINANFLQINTEPRWVFRISERIALRVKDKQALRRLEPRPALALQPLPGVSDTSDEIKSSRGTRGARER